MELHIRNASAGLGLAAGLLFPSPASAQASAQDKTSEIDKIFSWATPNVPGCAVAADFTNPVLRNIKFARLSDTTNGR